LKETVAGSTNKRVVAVRFDREPVTGFISPQTYLGVDGIELLTAGGAVLTIPYSELKALCFVRDFGGAGWKENRSFSNRPKLEGLWVRVQFRDGDSLEGVLANNLLLIETQGWTLTPPDAGGQNQRVFVPKEAATEVKVLGVVGRPLRRRAKPKPSDNQLKIFE
jgi:hypothetical protein